MGDMTRRCVVEKVAPFVFRIILVQGMNRQIRRMCEYFNYEVTKLERIRVMHIQLKGIPLGEWRELTPTEVEELTKVIRKGSEKKTERVILTEKKLTTKINPVT